jgi:hypothetical protein
MKYIITEPQFDTFFKRRLSTIDKIIDSSFEQLFIIFECKRNNLLFGPFWNMVVDDVLERTWNHMDNKRETLELDKLDKMVKLYLEVKKNSYETKYINYCKKNKK